MNSADPNLVESAEMTPRAREQRKERGRRSSWSSRGRPTLQLTTANVASQALSMLSGLVIARQLGADGRGQVTLVQVYDETSTKTLSLGSPTATGYLAKENPRIEDQILGAALTISAVSLPVTAAIGWLVATYVFRDAPVGIHLIVWAAVGLSPLANSYPMACRMVLVGRGNITALVPLQIAQMLLRFGAIVALAVGNVLTPTTAAVAVVLSGWAGGALGLFLVKVKPRRGGPIREMLVFGIKTMPASLANMANTRLDQMLIAPLISASALGIYAVAVGTTILPMAVGTAFALAGFHTVKRSDGFAGATPLLRKSFKVIAACGIVNAVGIILLLEPIYGEEFRPSIVPALILMPGAVATALFTVVGPVGNAIGEPAIASWGQTVGLAVTLIGLPFVIPVMGVEGAALVSSVSYCIRLAIGMWLLGRRGVRWR